MRNKSETCSITQQQEVIKFSLGGDNTINEYSWRSHFFPITVPSYGNRAFPHLTFPALLRRSKDDQRYYLSVILIGLQHCISTQTTASLRLTNS
jgi:hypothetical protein